MSGLYLKFAQQLEIQVLNEHYATKHAVGVIGYARNGQQDRRASEAGCPQNESGRLMKVSELSPDDVIRFARMEDTEADIDPSVLLAAAKGFVRGYTGLSDEELDEHDDMVLAVLVLCTEMYETRTMDSRSIQPQSYGGRHFVAASCESALKGGAPMPRDVSLAVSIKDNFSAPLSKASKSLEKLQQEAEKMGDKIDALNKRRLLFR